MNKRGSYSTIREPSEGIYKEKGSKFISYACPVTNTEQVQEILSKIRKEHHAASHHCYAYKIGTDPEIAKASDDGEPSNTAGKPILGQITSFGLTNIVIVVVRYFGGTLLGKGGLIRAYKNASADALHHASVIQVILTEPYLIITEYKGINDIMKLVGNDYPGIISSDYGEKVSLKIEIPFNRVQDFLNKIKRIEGVTIKNLNQN